MEVLIDCDILKNNKTGVESYTSNIIPALSKYADLKLLHNYDVKHNLFHNFKEIITNNFRFKTSHFIWSILKPIKPQTDIFHLPLPVAPFWRKPKNCKLIVTVHDLTPLKFPDFHNLKRKLYFRFFVKRLLKQADRIIADSISTKKDIVDLLMIKADKIDVVYLAADMKHTSKKVPKKYGIKDEYILYVGTVEPRKNLLRLIDAYNKLNPPEKLVIVGASGWKNKDVYKKKNKNIIFTGYVDDEDLPKLYSNAKVFIYPSLYEGFGLPVLEAMNCKVPVITSNTSSMPEVGGDAVLYVNPSSVDDIRIKLSKLLTDSNLRKELIKKGINQVKKFSWDKTAKETINVYKKVYNKK